MFCTNCGTIFQVGANFCGNCGVAVRAALPSIEVLAIDPNMISLQPSERRVLVGAFHGRAYSELAKPFPVHKDSVEAQASKVPFDATVAPDEEDLVPGDCVWAFDLPPEDFRGNPTYGSIDKRFAALGILRGRTFAEIVSYVGGPKASVPTADGGRSAVWGRQGLFAGIWQIGLGFDKYDVCVGVTSEVNG